MWDNLIHTALCRQTKFIYGITDSVQTTLLSKISLLVSSLFPTHYIFKVHYAFNMQLKKKVQKRVVFEEGGQICNEGGSLGNERYGVHNDKKTNVLRLIEHLNIISYFTGSPIKPYSYIQSLYRCIVHLMHWTVPITFCCLYLYQALVQYICSACFVLLFIKHLIFRRYI